MSSSTDRQYFASALGLVALAADGVILLQFVASYHWEAFWTFQWILSALFLFGLFGAGVGLLNVGNRTRARHIGLAVFGLAFMLAAIVLFSIWAYRQSAGGLSFPDYSGFLVLFGALIGVAVASIAAIRKEYLRFASYGFGVIDALYLLLLIQKYLFGSPNLELGAFLGEVVVLVLGIFLFLALFFGSEDSKAA